MSLLFIVENANGRSTNESILKNLKFLQTKKKETKFCARYVLNVHVDFGDSVKVSRKFSLILV